MADDHRDRCGAPVAAEFVMDDAYFEEFHGEWVAACGSGWRRARFRMVAAGAAGVVLGVHGWLRASVLLAVAAAALLAGAAGEGWSMAYRRRVWLRFCRSLPWHGRAMRLVLRDGELVQDNDYPGDRPGVRRQAVPARARPCPNLMPASRACVVAAVGDVHGQMTRL